MGSLILMFEKGRGEKRRGEERRGEKTRQDKTRGHRRRNNSERKHQILADTRGVCSGSGDISVVAGVEWRAKGEMTHEARK
jgi:hypothetical protein